MHSPIRATPLAEQLAAQIVEHVQTEALAPGTRLVERKLAEMLNVSRSPIRSALRLLESRRAVRRVGDGGYTTAPRAAKTRIGLLNGAGEELYLRIAEDHVSGRIPTKISENALIRKYKLGRGELVRILRRAAEEGWAERLPGHGWIFLPVLTSPEAYEQSYRFRILIEPAGILEPTFRLDRAALLRSREQQGRLLDGEGLNVSPAALFHIGSRFHETLIRCSNNAFLVDGLERMNRVRRLIEYRKIVDRQQWLRRCREHIRLIDILLDGDRTAAAKFLRAHLAAGAAAKTATP